MSTSNDTLPAITAEFIINRQLAEFLDLLKLVYAVPAWHEKHKGIEQNQKLKTYINPFVMCHFPSNDLYML